jgi:hypothetical protein|nr:hypothetical protein [Oxalobacteraceae bacterium]
MNISLRRAAALQNSIHDAIRELRLVRSIKLNEFQAAEPQLLQAGVDHRVGLRTRSSLMWVLYQIRQAVGRANAAAGIGDRLAQVALLDKEIQFYSELAGCQAREGAEVVAGRLDKIRNSPAETSYYRESVVESSVFEVQDIQEFRKLVSEHRRARQNLQDQILALNVCTEITLEDEAVQILQSAKLL